MVTIIVVDNVGFYNKNLDIFLNAVNDYYYFYYCKSHYIFFCKTKYIVNRITLQKFES